MQIQSSNTVGPTAIPKTNFRFFDKNETLSKIAELNYKQEPDQFSVIEKTKKIKLKVVKKQIVKKKYEVQKPKETSVVVSDFTKIDEFDFNRFTTLYYQPSDPIDLAVTGKLCKYDEKLDKVNTKNRVKLPGQANSYGNFTATDDDVLTAFDDSNTPMVLKKSDSSESIQEVSEEPEVEKSRLQVYATDVVISQLMCCLKSIYSWDLTVTKKNGKLIFDKRDGGVLDIETQDENAGEPVVEEGGNSIESLGVEATTVGKRFR